MIFRRYPSLLDTWVGWIAVAIRLKEPYAGHLTISKTVERNQIAGNNCPLQRAQNDFDFRLEKNPGYLVIGNRSEKVHNLGYTRKLELRVRF